MNVFKKDSEQEFLAKILYCIYFPSRFLAVLKRFFSKQSFVSNLKYLLSLQFTPSLSEDGGPLTLDLFLLVALIFQAISVS
jgi:hypothetical protein